MTDIYWPDGLFFFRNGFQRRNQRMAGPTMGVRSRGLTALGRVLRKHTTAMIQNTVVGQPGTKMPTVPKARKMTPAPSRLQRATG